MGAGFTLPELSAIGATDSTHHLGLELSSGEMHNRIGSFLGLGPEVEPGSVALTTYRV
jgi:hypothetical protein